MLRKDLNIFKKKREQPQVVVADVKIKEDGTVEKINIQYVDPTKIIRAR